MSDLHFEWDAGKSRSNQEKHGVSFSEATTVFYDEAALLLDDPDHSETEERFVLLGISEFLRALVVCHAVRDGGDLIRIISARRAHAREQQAYFARWTR
ncbi:MAG: BrnT family toxin [Myxococcota bacterium]